MRIPTIAGAVLVAAGLFFLFGGHFTSQREVLDLGVVTVTAEEEHPVQPWIAGLALIVGLALIGADVGRGKS